MSDAECIFVAGMRGSGKTTRVQSLIAETPRVVAFDPQGQYQRPHRLRGFDWPGAATLQELHGHLSRVWHQPSFRVALTVADDFELELHKLSVYLWGAMLPFERGRDKKKLTLIVEEMDLGAPNRPPAKGRGGFRRLVLQGRHRGIGVIGVTQHAALVPTWFRISCAARYLFACGVEDHGVMGARYRQAIAELAPHRYLCFAGGAVTRGENPAPASSRTAARPRRP